MSAGKRIRQRAEAATAAFGATKNIAAITISLTYALERLATHDCSEAERLEAVHLAQMCRENVSSILKLSTEAPEAPSRTPRLGAPWPPSQA